jgi:hypothetical protein
MAASTGASALAVDCRAEFGITDPARFATALLRPLSKHSREQFGKYRIVPVDHGAIVRRGD